jgi:hypothetical protein
MLHAELKPIQTRLTERLVKANHYRRSGTLPRNALIH